MGSETSVEKKTKDEVDEKIAEINLMTQDKIFSNKTSRFLDFNMEDGCLIALCKRKITCRVYNYENEAKTFHKVVSLNINQFYNFYEILKTAFDICIIEKIKERYSSHLESNEDYDMSICSICEDNKIDYKLSCSHFFCKDCIKKWIQKDKSCPMCRGRISNRTCGNDNDKQCEWDVMMDVNLESVKEDAELRFQAIMIKLFK